MARERILFVPACPGRGERRRATGCCSPSSRASTSRWTPPTSRAPRASRRSTALRARLGDDRERATPTRRGSRWATGSSSTGRRGRERARVAGIVETVVFGGQTVGMSLKTLRDVYGVTADSELALKATSEDARPVLERKVERIVERDYPNLSVLSNEELKSDVEDQVNQQFGIFYAIVGVAIFASLFGIVNTLSMSVIERTREIGVLRALGSTRWQVRRQIGDESLVIGLIGALLGIAVGAVLGWALLEGLSSGIPGVEYRPPRDDDGVGRGGGPRPRADRLDRARAPRRAARRDPRAELRVGDGAYSSPLSQRRKDPGLGNRREELRHRRHRARRRRTAADRVGRPPHAGRAPDPRAVRARAAARRDPDGVLPARHDRDREPRAGAARRRRRGDAVRLEPAVHPGRRRRALVDRYGAQVYAINGEDNDTYYRHINAAVDSHPQITMDDGADVVGVLHGERTGAALRGARRHRGDDDRRDPPQGARGRGQARLPDRRRQRRGHQALLRQPLRDRAVDARRDHPGHQRPDCRPAPRRDRVRDVRQGRRDAGQGPRRARDRLRGRPAASARGADGRLRGDAAVDAAARGRRVRVRDREPRRDQRPRCSR